MVASKTKNKRKAANGKLEEPEELAAWREIIEHADRLRALAEREPREVRLAMRLARRMTRDEQLQGEMVAEARDECEQARRDLRRLHTSIRLRPKRATPPDEIVRDLRAWMLLEARDAIREHLDGRRSERAEAMIMVLAKMYPGAPPKHSLAEIERLARRQRGNGSGSKERLARHMTALAAGLPLESATLRSLRNAGK